MTAGDLVAVRLDCTIADTAGGRRLDRTYIEVAPRTDDEMADMALAAKGVWARLVADLASVLRLHREPDEGGYEVYSVAYAPRPSDLLLAGTAERARFACRTLGHEAVHTVASRIVRTCRLADALPLRRSVLPDSLGAGNVAAMVARQPIPDTILASFPLLPESILLVAEPSQVDALMAGR